MQQLYDGHRDASRDQDWTLFTLSQTCASAHTQMNMISKQTLRFPHGNGDELVGTYHHDPMLNQHWLLIPTTSYTTLRDSLHAEYVPILGFHLKNTQNISQTLHCSPILLSSILQFESLLQTPGTCNPAE